ncbi:LuxR family transcriptional regulator [Micromonospora sp. CPCC 205371]|nr:LuxR family transcriptional regulator [Micromonospora sp. CPCC 205371]
MALALAWPLVGRLEELRFVTAATRPRSGSPGVVLAGAAGVGKTRLAREALAEAERRGVAVRWATATASSRALPLGAFAGLLGDVGYEATRVLARAAEALLVGAGSAGVVVGVDDAHLLDELSATLVHQLAQSRTAAVLVTVRTGEPAPDAVTALWKDCGLDRLEVQPLSEMESGRLLEAVLGGQVDRGAVGRLWTMSHGNVLYLRQLVDSAIDNAALRQEGGVWRLTGSPPVSPRLVDLIAARMGALSGPVGEVVDLLALGEPLDARVLGDLTDPATVEQAEEQGIVRVDTDGQRLQARLAHPLYGEARRTAIGQLRARRLRGRIATALDGTGADDLLRRALFTVVSALPPDLDGLVAAAERASYLAALALARRLAKVAVPAGGGFRAQALVAHATSFLGRPEEADVELAALARLAGSDGEFARASMNRATFLTWMLCRPDQAEAILDEAAARVTAVADRLPVTGLRAMLYGELGRPAEAERAARDVFDAATYSADAVLMASVGMVAALGVTGRADAMDGYVTRGIEAAAGPTERASYRIPLIACQMTGLRLAGYLDQAASAARECHEQIKDLPLGTQIGCYLMGETELGRGLVGNAVRWLREGRAGIEPFGDAGGWRYVTLIALTRALALAGDLDDAHRAADELAEHRHPGLALMDAEAVLARAWVAAAEGALSRAVALAHEAADLADRQGQLAHTVLCLHSAVRFGDHSPADRLAALAREVDGPRAPATAAHAAALAAGDGEALLAASAAMVEFGDTLAAAGASAQAAAVHAAADQRGAAHAAASRALRLAQACEGARTPALTAAARPLPLTQREREIVTLAARGLSNREIAARLVVSVRTVEGHLYRASAKLGTGNRAEYAGLLGLDGKFG